MLELLSARWIAIKNEEIDSARGHSGEDVRRRQLLYACAEKSGINAFQSRKIGSQASDMCRGQRTPGKGLLS